MKRLFLFLFISFTLTVFSQNTVRYQQLNSKVAFYVNELRDSLGLPILQSDSILNIAAFNHAVYMSKYNLLEHEQKFPKTKTPFQRVKLAGGNEFEIVGENIQFQNVEKFPKNDKKIDALAFDIFKAWKKSPPHYANMINPDYVYCDFGFAFNVQSQKLYAAQVFGTKGFVVPNQLSENTYGLTFNKKSKNCDSLFSNMLLNMGNSIEVKNGVVYLEHFSKRQVLLSLNKPTDGIAVDLVRRDQFMCHSPNTLDISPVYDGVLLKPVYFNELMSNNSAQSDYRLISPIGTIPEALLDKDVLPSIVIIKDGQACRYVIPAYHPNDTYDLIPIEPELTIPQGINYSEFGIVASNQINFEFKRNQKNATTVDDEQKLDTLKINQISILAYTSIEGDTVINNKLHTKRANYIKSYLKRNHYTISDSLVNVIAKENWDKCYFQLELLGLDNLLKVSQDSIRSYVVSDSLQNWDSLLFEQRKSMAIIHYEAYFDSTQSELSFLEMNLRTAILKNQINVANKALADIYYQDMNSLVLFEEEIFNALKSNPDLVQNASAVFSKMYMIDLYKVTEFVGIWLTQPDNLNHAAKVNLLQLYNITARALLDNWDTSSQQLAKVLHPSKILKLTTQIQNNELLLNYHLAAIDYYGQINDSEGIHKSFSFIRKHFEKADMEIEEVNKLCLFFNSWSMGTMTIDFLFNRIDNPEFNEQAAFILATTLSGFPDKLNEIQRNKVYQKAYDLNPERWCEWVNSEFQILRNSQAKTIYCSHCD